MKFVSKIFSSKKAIALIVAIVVVIVLLLVRAGGVVEKGEGNAPAATTTAQLVEMVSVHGGAAGNRVNTTGTVESEAQATLTTESTGVVQQVSVEIGDAVTAGQLLVRLSSADEQAALAQANASLQAQKARLAELKAGTRATDLDTARANLRQAEIDLLNTDLQAYLDDSDARASGSLQPPTISGTYQDEETGEYYISLYQSGSQSGYSFRYSGLETGISPASSEVPQPLGDRGLYIEFPDDFAANPNVDWVVPVPNTRSSQHSQAQTRLVQAQNNFQSAQEGTRSEQIQAQEAAVAQAEASVVAAQARLSKKQILAPFGGEVTAVHVSIGELVSPSQSVVELVNANTLQVTSYVSAGAATGIQTGDPVHISGEVDGVVQAVSSAVGQQSGKVEVKIQVIDPSSTLIVGEFVSVEIAASGNGSGEVTIPLTAVKNDTQGAYVLAVNTEGRTERVDVETGSIRGDTVVVTEGLVGVEEVVRDIRNLTVGAAVSTN